MVNVLTNILKNDRLDAYPLFKKFCFLKEKGLRKESFKALSAFIDEAKTWDNNVQQHFASWLFALFEESDNIHHILVYPLEEELLKPLLERWMKSNPEDPRPYRWYGVFLNTEKRVDYLNNALRRGGSNEQLSLLTLIDINLNALWYSFHHISEDLYLGDIKEDTVLLAKSRQLNNKVECEQTRKNNNEALNYYQDLLNDWVMFKEERSKGFVEWCENKDRNYYWVKAYYYEK
ncbi:hypothetical protein BHT95_16445 [Bacillus paralicheniformis]|uniref:hypothetical protein n=1 Tax=Bacillus TaxID=1386 RepID=UPI000950EA84|nr:hypothetical protein [Bacillus paralicheniformis]MSO00806.1 hypothetical protein [Bacillus paralicheniformis]MSO04814.1 hypothetical protein [Bacillus paralicheniformis]MSO08807.1 hypothetical protein [Bacillus paralicheniformis]MSO12801.1 hypothetical protein [Bacillus paralicheniformis]NJE39298.1 hypothetical protein [Bacillus paralicheniformis]